jgi:hypothetical protein
LPSSYQISASILGERGLVIVKQFQCPPYGQAAAGFLLLMAFAVFRLPPWLPLFAIESNGVDPSWQMLLNEAVTNDWVFGRDLFFTYGPFGFIHARMYHPETWGILIAAWIGISVIMADLVWRVTGHGRLSLIGRTLCGIAMLEFMSRDAMAVCFSLHAFVLLHAFGVAQFSRVAATAPSRGRQPTEMDRNENVRREAAAAEMVSVTASRLRAVSIIGTLQTLRQAIPILLLAALPWAKFSYFVTATFLGCTLVAAAVLQRRIPWRAILLFAACPLAWSMSGATLTECCEFIGTGFQLAGGYGAAMGLGPESTAGLVVLVSAGFVVLMLPVWLTSRLQFSDWRMSVLTMLFFHGLLFVAWKSCFVRYHTERIPVFLGTVFPLLAYGWLVSGQFESRSCATGSASAVSIESAKSWKHWRSQWHTFVPGLHAAERRCGLPLLMAGLVVLVSAGIIERVQPLTFGNAIGHTTGPLRDQVLAVAESVRNPNWRLSTHEAQLQKIRDANPIPDVDGSVDVFPSKLIVAFAHGLDLRPRPVLQSYAAFTPALIERDARHFRGDNAPNHVLVSVGEIDNRLPTMEDSRAWFELLSRYELTDSRDDLLKLSRRDRPRLSLPAEPTVRTIVKLGEPFDVPASSSGLIWCRIQIKPAAVGHLASILYRLPELRLRTIVSATDESQRDFRLLPGSAEAGFLLGPLVENREDLIQLWSSDDDSRQTDVSPKSRVVSISCSTTDQTLDTLLYQPEIIVEFFDVRLPEPTFNDSSGSVGIARRVSPTF